MNLFYHSFKIVLSFAQHFLLIDFPQTFGLFLHMVSKVDVFPCRYSSKIHQAIIMFSVFLYFFCSDLKV